MNEGLKGFSDVSSADEDSVQSTGGALLRKAREAKGLHIAALAVLLKVSVKKLEAIEANQFELLPDIVFVRALASSICRNLNIDAGPILEKLPPMTAQGLKTDESGINTPFRASGEPPGFTQWLNFSKPLLVASVLLFIAICAFVWFTWMDKHDPVLPLQADLSSANVFATKPMDGVSDVPVSTASAALVSSDLASIFPVTESATAIAPAGATAHDVLFKARGVSWVEVVDAQGVVQLRKTLKSGDMVGASGSRPLSVFVGRVDSVDVTVLGNPFDLKRIAKDNAARFEVKQ
jgi:cytoskeleton protein RodZ